MFGLGACLSAVQLLPGWELTAEGTRSPGPLTRWQQFPFGWFGPGVGEAFAKTLQAPFPLLTLSFGWVALVCLAAASFWKAHRVLAILCSSMAAGVILFAMGPVTPLFDWIAQLPALTWFRFPRRSLFLALPRCPLLFGSDGPGRAAAGATSRAGGCGRGPPCPRRFCEGGDPARPAPPGLPRPPAPPTRPCCAGPLLGIS